jgi:hypothetical protein
MADNDKEWNPEDEVDPIELQKQQLALGKKFMERIEKEDAEKAKREDEADRYARAPVYTPPPPLTFEERCVRIEKAWTETKRLVPDAPDHVKTLVFQSLLSSSGESVLGYGAIGSL